MSEREREGGGRTVKEKRSGGLVVDYRDIRIYTTTIEKK